jgi:hypothetical protein
MGGSHTIGMTASSFARHKIIFIYHWLILFVESSVPRCATFSAVSDDVGSALTTRRTQQVCEFAFVLGHTPGEPTASAFDFVLQHIVSLLSPIRSVRDCASVNSDLVAARPTVK